MATSEQTRRNLDHYGELAAGRSDYWRLMAAPRFRVKTILGELQKVRPGSILDLGCGDGSLLLAIAQVLPGAKLIGVDLSAAQIDENRKRAPEIEWLTGNVEDEEFRFDGRYAAIVCSELIEHLAEPVQFLKSARRVAADDALLILSTQSGRVGETERRVGHLRHFTTGEMSAILADAGWTPIRLWNAGFPFQDLSKWIANLAPDYSMRHFGERRYGWMERFASLALRLLFALNSRSRGAQLFAVARKAGSGSSSDVR